MKLRKLVLIPIAVASMAFGTPAIANTLTFQGVTFETLAVDSDTLTLNITNATSAGGDWAGINYLKAFEIKNIGDVTGATLTGWTTNVDNGLNSGLGCTSGNTKGACFSTTPAFALLPSMSFTIDFVGTGMSFDSPELKVQFLTGIDATNKTGSLLSRNISPIPEPEIYAMMLAGLGLMGFVARRRHHGSAA